MSRAALVIGVIATVIAVTFDAHWFIVPAAVALAAAFAFDVQATHRADEERRDREQVARILTQQNDRKAS